ncbi:MAG TPA: hypothetical protein DDZ51_26050 [Planctomycetaceae bacterium]|nr:hypothetical protein [Planctomycetaceae bacterium]
MALDLLTAVMITAAISVAAWLGGRQVGMRFERARMPLFVTLILATAWFASSWNGRMENVLLFSIGPAILLSNLTPVLSCFLAGLAWEMPGIPQTRRAISLGAFVTLAVALFLAPLLRPILKPATASDLGQWKDGVCVQTHNATCGAAAVATMLRHYGMMVTEKELVGECLTSEDGTEPLAVYRALTIYANQMGHKPKLASSDPLSWQDLQQFPVLAMVSPIDSDRATPTHTGRLRSLLGRSSEGHAVVILGRNTNGDFVVGDPSNGRVIWSPRQMTGYYSGQGIYLEQGTR